MSQKLMVNQWRYYIGIRSIISRLPWLTITTLMSMLKTWFPSLLLLMVLNVDGVISVSANYKRKQPATFTPAVVDDVEATPSLEKYNVSISFSGVWMKPLILEPFTWGSCSQGSFLIIWHSSSEVEGRWKSVVSLGSKNGSKAYIQIRPWEEAWLPALKNIN